MFVVSDIVEDSKLAFSIMFACWDAKFATIVL